MTLAILDATADADARQEFENLPGRVYAADRWYSAPAADPILAAGSRENPSVRLFVAAEGGRAVARVAALLNDSLRDSRGVPLGILGDFEAEDRPDAVRAVLDAAEAWLRSRGAGDVVGPMDGSTWRRYRFNIGPFDSPPFLYEPWNPPYYGRRWEECGFERLEEYHSKRVDGIAELPRLLETWSARAETAGYSIRPLNLKSFEEDLGRLYELSRSCFSGNFLYSDLPRAEFDRMYRGLGSRLEPGMVLFATAPDGSDAGFVFAFREPGNPELLNVKTLGVVLAARRHGIASALMSRAYSAGHALGCRSANLCLIRDGNPSEKMDAGQGRISRRYALYVRRRGPTA